jgi:DNA-binding MarR family transcriptional regulator
MSQARARRATPKMLAPSRAPNLVAKGAEPDAFRVWLRFLRLDQRLRLLMGRCLREIGLSIPQFDVLSALSEGAGITQRQLAQQLFVTKGNVSGLIDRLVEAKLVERRRGAQDRRSHALFLTAEGKRIATAGFATQKAFVDGTLGQLPQDQLARLHELLGRWRDAARDAEQAHRQGDDRSWAFSGG